MTTFSIINPVNLGPLFGENPLSIVDWKTFFFSFFLHLQVLLAFIQTPICTLQRFKSWDNNQYTWYHSIFPQSSHNKVTEEISSMVPFLFRFVIHCGIGWSGSHTLQVDTGVTALFSVTSDSPLVSPTYVALLKRSESEKYYRGFTRYSFYGLTAQWCIRGACQIISWTSTWREWEDPFWPEPCAIVLFALPRRFWPITAKDSSELSRSLCRKRHENQYFKL